MKKILIYILVTFVFSWSCWGISILAQNGYIGFHFQLFGQFAIFGPLVGFIVVNKVCGIKLKDAFKQLFVKSHLYLIIFAIVSPFILSGVSYLFVDEPMTVDFMSVIPLALMILFVGGPIEEFGWRGYLMPVIRKQYGVIITVFIVGIIHGIWHLPLHYLEGTVQEALPIYQFLIITVATTMSYGFIYEFTKSIIPMILLHWFGNLSSAILPYFYEEIGRYVFLTVVVVLDLILIGILYYKKTTKVY